MNGFALGYGLALAGCFTSLMLYLSARDGPPPNPTASAAALAFGTVLIAGAGWFIVRALFTAVQGRDLWADFRAADPRGRRAPLAGFLSGVVGIASGVGTQIAIAPSGHKRDPTTILAGALTWVLICGSPVAGAVLFLWLFRPRSSATLPGGP
jgi:hypothetical protein